MEIGEPGSEEPDHSSSTQAILGGLVMPAWWKYMMYRVILGMKVRGEHE